MQVSWTFKEAGPGDRARVSQVEKFFNSDAVSNRANGMVREGIQNSLDAAAKDSKVRVRVTLGEWTTEERVERLGLYASGFFEHFDVDAVRTKMSEAPGKAEAFKFMVFEDFGTVGLKGDPAQWWPDDTKPKNPFMNYFRAEGLSDKSDGARGRHGVGRLVFMFASRTRSMLALTRRDDAAGVSELVMGTTVLRNHRLGDKPYLPDGWFGVADEVQAGLVLPSSDADFIADFKHHFSISRADENGLSVVVPWINDDVTATAIVLAVLEGYFYPILASELSVEVVDATGQMQTINAATIEAIVEAQASADRARLKPLVALALESLTAPNPIALNLPPVTGAPKWELERIPESAQQQIHGGLEAGQLVALRVPVWVREKTKPAVESYFSIYMQRDAELAEAQIQFIREGIIISDVRPRRSSGIRALVVIEKGSLATFLGDAENPSHTEWQAQAVRDRYSYHKATIDYVEQCVPQVLAIISRQQTKPDTSLLIDLFSLPSDDPSHPKAKQKKQQPKDGGESKKPELDLPKKLRRFKISKHASGFIVRRGDPTATQPEELSIKVAYSVRRGNPFTKYNRADFLLGRDGIATEFTGCKLLGTHDNEMQVRIHDADFEIAVTGFDTSHRDLEVDVKVKGSDAPVDHTDDAAMDEEQTHAASL